jgi:hypothetical protein
MSSDPTVTFPHDALSATLSPAHSVTPRSVTIAPLGPANTPIVTPQAPPVETPPKLHNLSLSLASAQCGASFVSDNGVQEEVLGVPSTENVMPPNDSLTAKVSPSHHHHHTAANNASRRSSLGHYHDSERCPSAVTSDIDQSANNGSFPHGEFSQSMTAMPSGGPLTSPHPAHRHSDGTPGQPAFDSSNPSAVSPSTPSTILRARPSSAAAVLPARKMARPSALSSPNGIELPSTPPLHSGVGASPLGCYGPTARDGARVPFPRHDSVLDLDDVSAAVAAGGDAQRPATPERRVSGEYLDHALAVRVGAGSRASMRHAHSHMASHVASPAGLLRLGTPLDGAELHGILPDATMPLLHETLAAGNVGTGDRHRDAVVAHLQAQVSVLHEQLAQIKANQVDILRSRRATTSAATQTSLSRQWGSEMFVSNHSVAAMDGRSPGDPYAATPVPHANVSFTCATPLTIPNAAMSVVPDLSASSVDWDVTPPPRLVVVAALKWYERFVRLVKVAQRFAPRFGSKLRRQSVVTVMLAVVVFCRLYRLSAGRWPSVTSTRGLVPIPMLLA